MKRLLILILKFSFLISYSQSNTEIYVFDLNISKNTISITNPINISNNKGYDSQPFFEGDNQLIFSSNRNGQTDIATYDINTKTKRFYSNTAIGSEYSPQPVPGLKHKTAVRLDTTGLQRLYIYRSKPIRTIIKNFKVAYYTWFDENTIVSAVIENDSLNLFTTFLKDHKSRKYAKNVGRSFHKIPNTKLVSFISKENPNQWQIKSLNPLTGETKFITNTIENSEDLCWLNDGSILMTQKNQIFISNPSKGKDWTILKSFKDNRFQNLTRIATNLANNRLALVSEMTPENIVQQQLDTYNNRDIEGFSKVFSEDVKIYEFPNTLLYDGKTAMKARYKKLFEDTPDLNSTIQSRIIQGNTVIDHEYITANGRNFTIVAIYEVNDGQITKATFIR